VELAPGATIASVSLDEPIVRGDRIECWRGTWPDGSAATIHAIKPSAGQRERDNFLSGARKLVAAMRGRPLPGVVSIAAVVPTEGAYVTRQSTAGTMADVPVLEWDIGNTVKFMRRLCHAVDKLHGAGLTHGCLCPGNVLLDDDLNPRLSDVGMLVIDDSYDGPSDMKHDYSAYAAREVRIGHPATSQSDVFSLGRLLYFLLDGAEPEEPDEELPVLHRLEDAPAGLVRIIRRCTTRDPERRYPVVDAVLDDLERYDRPELVGRAHPHGREVLGDDGEGLEEDDESPVPDSMRPSHNPQAVGGESKSQRPGRSARPSESTRPGPAIPRGAAAAKPEPTPVFATYAGPDVAEEDDLLTPQQARLAGAIGAVVLVAALAFAFFAGRAPTVVLGAIVVGAVLLSLLVPVLGGAPLLTRMMAALILGTAGWMLDPATVVAEVGRTSKFTKGTAQQRGARIHQLRDRGVADFTRLDLSTTDFRGFDLSGVRFDGSQLVSARFEGCKLEGVSFADAHITGCNFSDADLTGVSVTTSVGWPETVCNSATVMPEGWTCDSAKPVSLSSFGTTGVRTD
jgi:hypothetical protein